MPNTRVEKGMENFLLISMASSRRSSSLSFLSRIRRTISPTVISVLALVFSASPAIAAPKSSLRS